jgi:hypothetical protein
MFWNWIFRIFSANNITKNINAQIIPTFNTSAEGCGFFCPKILIIYNVRTIKSRIDNKSFIIKNRNESLEKKSSRYIKIPKTSDAIIHRIRLMFILILLRFNLIRFILNVLLLHCKINQILHHLKKRIMSGKWFELW